MMHLMRYILHTPFNAAESTPLNDASRISKITANVIEVRVGQED